MKTYSHLNRRSFVKTSVLAAAAMGGTSIGFKSLFAAAANDKPPGRGIPVILATDIGDDIDDTWALGFLLKCPELDLKLAVTDFGKPKYRGKLLGKFLQAAGRADVPIGVGPDAEPRGDGPQAAWVQDYDLGSYPGKVHSDGVQAIIDVIMRSKTPVTLISIGPMPNVAAALAKEPRIATRARFVGMDGSVRLGYGGSKTISAEWNVKAAPQAAQQVLSAPWDITITPLDTCGLVTLEGDGYRRLLKSSDPVTSTILENYRIWSRSNKTAADAEDHSSTLFDTVAVYLAVTQELCKMERLGIRVTDDGFTLLDDHAKQMNVATEWKSLDGYRDFLVNRLLQRSLSISQE
jgi:inosine-uridine nucleoside N-ribohydrolase